MTKNIVLYWSGGKDSAMAFQEIATSERYSDHRITSLLTTLTAGYDRITGHGVRRELLERQAACLGLDVVLTYIPKKSTMAQYEDVMEDALRKLRLAGSELAATGDIFLEKQRIAMFKNVGMKSCFPLLLRNTRDYVCDLIDRGIKAYVICVNSAVLDQSFVGRVLDREFLNDLPFGVDPCGENGEYHTFVFDGPIFRNKVECKLGRTVFREGFYFCDVLPT
jgi:uncharacterized protein (TIGR00290 family)